MTKFGLPDDFLKSTAAITAQVQQYSALNPLLWIVGLITVVLGILAFLTSHLWIAIVFVSLIAIAILSSIGCYIFFAIKHPDLLRSEKFQLIKQELERLGDQNHTIDIDDVKNIIVDVDSNTVQKNAFVQVE